MKHRLRYNLVDVFTDTPLTGNPLAVFTNGRGLSTSTMQAIAGEMNLSETVFFLPPENGGHAKLRIFTPRSELPFAGHPVLGSAWVLAHPMEMAKLDLETGAGTIAVHLERQGGKLHRATMHQPLPRFSEDVDRSAVLSALGFGERRSSSLLGPTVAENGPWHVLVEVEDEATLDRLQVDRSALARCSRGGVLVFSRAGSGFACRYFAPAAGIDEDPATGSACGPLGLLLYRTGRLEAGHEMIVRQGKTMGRPSTLFVTIRTSDGHGEEVLVGGAAVVIGRGELDIAG